MNAMETTAKPQHDMNWNINFVRKKESDDVNSSMNKSNEWKQIVAATLHARARAQIYNRIIEQI